MAIFGLLNFWGVTHPKNHIKPKEAIAVDVEIDDFALNSPAQELPAQDHRQEASLKWSGIMTTPDGPLESQQACRKALSREATLQH